ncbi:N-acetylglucosamine-6-sulfatase-like isoform X2 [Littorina saxatilis]|uniref:N-acetylglucosamine-6-sulfatase-like isoform X2 n=1 Tax=Littorina saxatilis TaxID=31220 RepID=UPI0038B596A7
MFVDKACVVVVAAILVVAAAQSTTTSTPKPPNIVFVLTDDQDLVLGGMEPMQKTTNLIGKQGITFENAFVSVPICCPSRSSFLTGKYQHNHHAFNNSVAGGCSSTSWQQEQEPKAFPVYLKQQGYSTFYAGKYLNRYGYDNVGGTAHVPPGWDWWVGLVGNSVYYDYDLSVNGTTESHGHDYLEDYLTDLINRKGQEFLELQNDNSAPFFMMLSAPACHEPFPSAPHYSHYYAGKKAPRDHGSFNVKAHDKHWLLEQPIIPMPNDTLDLVDDFYQNRLRTLLSVDDMVEDVYNVLRRKKMLDNTYLFFTSDHGYHLGQFGLPYDKREPYEFDIRVPLMVKGPGIKAGMVSKVADRLIKRKTRRRRERRKKRREEKQQQAKNIWESPMNIDFGPTFISLAGGSVPSFMDGKTMEPLWRDPVGSKGFRDNVLIEYSGEEKQSINGCPQLTGQRVFNCNHLAHCVCEDAHNNTFACVRSTMGSNVYKYCEFKDDASFVEMYDLIADPWELTNLEKNADTSGVQATLKQALHELTACSGATCNIQKLKTKTIRKEAKKSEEMISAATSYSKSEKKAKGEGKKERKKGKDKKKKGGNRKAVTENQPVVLFTQPDNFLM